MILYIECAVDSDTLIDDIIEWRVNAYVFKFYPGEQRTFQKISVECKFPDYAEHVPKVTIANQQLVGIEFPKGDFYAEQVSLLQYLESFSALDLGVRRIYWDNPRINWIAESEEERIAINGYSRQVGYPANNRKITLGWVQQTLIHRGMVKHLTEPLSFYRIGLNHYHGHYYIQAFLHFYLMLEGAFAKGNSRKDHTIAAFLSEANLVFAIQTTLENLEKPNSSRQKSWFDGYVFNNPVIDNDPVRKMINILVDQRGKLAHNAGINAERRRNNFEERAYQPLASIAMSVCLFATIKLRLDPYRKKE